MNLLLGFLSGITAVVMIWSVTLVLVGQFFPQRLAWLYTHLPSPGTLAMFLVVALPMFWGNRFLGTIATTGMAASLGIVVAGVVIPLGIGLATQGVKITPALGLSMLLLVAASVAVYLTSQPSPHS